jgi:superfamily II DNA helicase RecQ
VQTFKSTLSEKGKELCWDKFRDGKIRILCATDAAGIGCNVPDVEFVVMFKLPRSLSVLSQRWGRAGRDRTISATCLLFVPKWAFRPKENDFLAGKKETKADTERRKGLEKPLENFVNSGERLESSHVFTILTAVRLCSCFLLIIFPPCHQFEHLFQP